MARAGLRGHRRRGSEKATQRTAALRTAGLHDASFPALTIAFQRTLQIPDGRTCPLPAGLGAFPLRSVDDFPATAPASCLQSFRSVQCRKLTAWRG